MPEDPHTCPEPIEVGLAALRVAQSKDITAIRTEIQLRFDANTTAVSAAFESQKALVDKTFMAQEMALKLQTAANDKHFVQLNGEAAHLKAMQETYMPRESGQLQFDKLSEKIDDLKSAKDTAAGRQSVTSAIIAFVISLVFVLLNLYFSKR